MKYKNLKLLLVLAMLFIPTKQLNARDKKESFIETQFSVGYGYDTTIKTTDDIKAFLLPLTMALSYENNFWNLNRYQIGAVFQHGIIAFSDKDTAYEGQNVLAGARLAFNLLEFEEKFYQITVDYMPYANLTVSSDSESTVNEGKYRHSSLTEYSKGAAMEVRFGYTNETISGQFSRQERLRFGFYIGYLNQTFKKKSVIVVTSNSELAPSTESEFDIDGSLKATTLNFMSAFAF